MRFTQSGVPSGVAQEPNCTELVAEYRYCILLSNQTTWLRPTQQPFTTDTNIVYSTSAVFLSMSYL